MLLSCLRVFEKGLTHVERRNALGCLYGDEHRPEQRKTRTVSITKSSGLSSARELDKMRVGRFAAELLNHLTNGAARVSTQVSMMKLNDGLGHMERSAHSWDMLPRSPSLSQIDLH